MITQTAPILSGIRHMVTHHERTTAIFGAYFSWSVGRVAETATGDAGLGLWTQLGVAGLVVVAILFMLRRSDRREAKKDRAIERIEDARIADLKQQIADLQAENDALRSPRPPTARTRATDRKKTSS